MAHVFGEAAQSSITRGGDTTHPIWRMLRDGTGVTAPWLQVLALEGRIYGVSYGSANKTITAVGTFGAGAADLDEFDLLQTIPASVGVLPVYFKVGFLAIGSIAETGAALVWGNSGVISNGITCVPYNMHAGSSNVSACTVTGLGDDGGTAMTVDGVIFHEATTALTGVAATPAQLGYQWSVADTGFAPPLNGAAGTGRQVAGFAHAQAGTGYLTYMFAELPIAAIE